MRAGILQQGSSDVRPLPPTPAPNPLDFCFAASASLLHFVTEPFRAGPLPLSFFLSLFFFAHHCHPRPSTLPSRHLRLTNLTAALPSTSPAPIFTDWSAADPSIHTLAHFLIIVTPSFLIFYLRLSPPLFSPLCLFARAPLDNISSALLCDLLYEN